MGWVIEQTITTPNGTRRRIVTEPVSKRAVAEDLLEAWSSLGRPVESYEIVSTTRKMRANKPWKDAERIPYTHVSIVEAVKREMDERHRRAER